jgi:hypothetical protein
VAAAKRSEGDGSLACQVSGTSDNEATVYFRWSYEILDDRAYPYSGWNIDDIELLGKL